MDNEDTTGADTTVTDTQTPPETKDPTPPTKFSEDFSNRFIDEFLTGEHIEDESDDTTTEATTTEATTTPAPVTTTEATTTEATTTPAPGDESDDTTTVATTEATTPAPVTPAPPIDYDKIGKSVADAMQQNTPAPPAPSYLTDKDRRKIDNLKSLESLYPDQYKGIADKFQNSRKAEVDYRAKWESANPGERFDPEAQEHDSFYDKNDVSFDNDDYLEAIAERRANAKTTKVQQELEQHRRVSALEPKIKEFRKDTRKEVVKEHQEIMDKPVLGEIVSEQASFAEEVVEATHRLFNGETFDRNNQIHQRAEQFAMAAERDLMSQPVDKQRDSQGRQFVPSEQYMKLTDEQRAGAWTLDAEHVTQFVVGVIKGATTDRLKAEQEKMDKYLEAQGYVKSETGAATATAPKTASTKPKSPSSSAAPKTAPSENGDGKTDGKWQDNLMDSFING